MTGRPAWWPAVPGVRHSHATFEESAFRDRELRLPKMPVCRRHADRRRQLPDLQRADRLIKAAPGRLPKQLAELALRIWDRGEPAQLSPVPG